MRDERNNREKKQSEDSTLKRVSEDKPEAAAVNKSKVEPKSLDKKDFILSCIVLVDPKTNLSRHTAFVDFSSKQAAQVCLKAWHEGSMQKYPNRL